MAKSVPWRVIIKKKDLNLADIAGNIKRMFHRTLVLSLNYKAYKTINAYENPIATT